VKLLTIKKLFEKVFGNAEL